MTISMCTWRKVNTYIPATAPEERPEWLDDPPLFPSEGSGSEEGWVGWAEVVGFTTTPPGSGGKVAWP